MRHNMLLLNIFILLFLLLKNIECVSCNVTLTKKRKHLNINTILVNSKKQHRLHHKELKSIKGKTVRIIAKDMMPYLMSNLKSQTIDGLLGNIWTIMKEDLKFSVKITSSSFDEGFEMLKKGTQDVMLGAIVSTAINHDVEYSQPLFYNWYQIYMRKPKKYPSSSSYLRTFNSHLWIASATTFLVLSLFLWGIVKMINRFKHEKSQISILTCLLVVCGGFLNQGYCIKINRVSLRILIFTSFVFGFLLYSSMTAVLVSQLTIMEYSMPINTLEDIPIKQTRSMCLREESFVYRNFTNSKNELLPMWRNIINAKGCLNVRHQENIMKSVCENDVLVLESRAVIAAVIKRFSIPCDVVALTSRWFGRYNLFAMSKKFVYRKSINKYLTKLMNYGILQRLQKEWVDLSAVHSTQHQVMLAQVTLGHVQGIIIIFAVAILISMFILCLELLNHRYRDV